MDSAFFNIIKPFFKKIFLALTSDLKTLKEQKAAEKF